MPFSVDRWRSDAAADAARLAPGRDTGAGFAALVGGLQSNPGATTPPLKGAPTPGPALYTVASGDTLSGIVQQMAQQRGLNLSADQRHRMALELASHNQIANPDRIMPGQTLRLQALQAALEQVAPLAQARPPATVQPAQDWLARRSQAPGPGPQAASRALLSPQTQRAIPNSTAAAAGTAARNAHPVLQQTLERAVARGFIPPQEKQAVQDKILQLAQKYHFAPDDFARMTLMESDGMNPKASNQRCHGIIQFCDGPNRGAATVGFAQQPRAILGLSVHQQLSLVDTYFQEAGLGKQGRASLDDLYLTVLQPAARQEKQAHAPLPIAGPQARDLHVGADTNQAITRQSIVQGLLKNTRDKLGQLFGQSPPPRPAAAQVSQAPGERDTLLR